MQTLKKSKTQHSDQVRNRMIIAIYHLLRAKGETRSRLAIATRMHMTSAVSISRWESLEGYPTIENIVDFCREFGISIVWMMLGEGSMYGDKEIIVRLDDLEKRVQHLEGKRK